MAHYKKINSVGVSSILAHDNRTQKTLGSNIDESLICKNYNLRQHEISEYQFYKKRKQEVLATGSRFNSRSVGLISCVITIPKDFAYYGNEEKEKEFFEECCKFLDEKHGSENCVSAWVHRDECKMIEGKKTETSAENHLHYCTMPIEKDGDVLKFNAKKILTKTYLKKFHKDLQKHLSEHFGFKVNILNDITQGDNKTIEQLKELSEEKEKLKEDVQEQNEEIQAQKQVIAKNYDILKLQQKNNHQDEVDISFNQLEYILQSDLFFELPEHLQTELSENLYKNIHLFDDLKQWFLELNDCVVNDLVVQEVVDEKDFVVFDEETQTQIENEHSLDEER